MCNAPIVARPLPQGLIAQFLTRTLSKTARPAANPYFCRYTLMPMANCSVQKAIARMNKQYTPIPCAVYSELELMIMHREQLRLCYIGAGEIMRIEPLYPTDLRTRSKGEYLIAQSAGACRVLRLDRIRSFDII